MTEANGDGELVAVYLMIPRAVRDEVRRLAPDARVTHGGRLFASSLRIEVIAALMAWAAHPDPSVRQQAAAQYDRRPWTREEPSP